jgi:hypothetical protein
MKRSPVQAQTRTPDATTPLVNADLSEASKRLIRALFLTRRGIGEVLRENRGLQSQISMLRDTLIGLAEGGEPPSLVGTDPALETVSEALKVIAHRMARSGKANDNIEDALKRNALLKAENTDLVSRCQELMKENNNLFKLYVASQHLHSSLYLGEVLEMISEIMLNVVGASDYALFLYEEREQLMMPVLVKGLDGQQPGKVKVGEGPVGEAVASTQTYVMNEEAAVGGRPSPQSPLVAIPLKARERLMGAIAIYGLLAHKPKLDDVDFALFDFFAAHAATAIQSATLYGESERKVSTMKEFMTLMKGPNVGSGAG